MKKLITPSLACAVTLAISSCFASVPSNSVKEIMDGLQKEKAAKLETYLKENPKADDRLEGVSHLINAYLDLAQSDKLDALYKEKYELLLAVEDIKDVALDELLLGTVRPIIVSLINSGNKKEALSFFAKVKGELAPHPLARRFGPYFQQIAAMLDVPGGGEVLEIAFTDVNGHEVDLAAMKGKVVLVDFWATWCPPCIEEFPNLLKTYDQYHDEGFEIIGISLDEDAEGAKRLLHANKIPWYQQVEGKSISDNKFTKEYKVTMLPTIFLIGKDGKIAATFLRGPQLREAVKRELKK